MSTISLTKFDFIVAGGGPAANLVSGRHARGTTTFTWASHQVPTFDDWSKSKPLTKHGLGPKRVHPACKLLRRQTTS